MEISRLESKHSDFYVPTFKVALNGKDLVRELLLTVTDAEIDLKEKAPGRFSFTVANAFDWKSRAFIGKASEKAFDLIELFSFGSPIEMFFGYGAPADLMPMMKGIVTELSTSFTGGDIPQLTVAGFDRLFPLTKGKLTRKWEKSAALPHGVRDSDAVNDLLKGTGLNVNIMSTNPRKLRIDQNQQADIAFLKKLAERNKATFYVHNDDFYFGPRNNDKTDIVKLAWGKGLFSFSPELNLESQVEKVEVLGWSAKKGEPILGVAEKRTVSGSEKGSKSGPELVAEALNTNPAMRVRAAVHTQGEADARARAILEERAQKLLQGTGESIGLPEILPDMNIELTGIGKPFSKTYYVCAAKHRIDSGGYRTTFNVKEPQVNAELDV